MARVLRLLLTSVFLLSALLLSVFSYTREGESWLTSLPLLTSSINWLDAAPEFALTLGFGSAVLALAGYLARDLLARYRVLCISAMVFAATSGAFAYDGCRESGLTWLPEIHGCHCWITGMTALLAALLASCALALIGILTCRIVGALHALFVHYVRHDVRRLHRRAFQAIVMDESIIAVRLNAFRGPPVFTK